MRLLPAPPNHGIRFERADVPLGRQVVAHYESVVCTRLATTLGWGESADERISTVEHLMAALFGSGITNALVQVEGQ